MVLNGHHPVVGVIGVVAQDGHAGVEELGRDVLLEWRGLTLAHPDEHPITDYCGRIDTRLELAGHARIWSLCQEGDAFACAVEGRAVVRAGDEAVVVALALAEAGSPVRTHV